MRRGPLLPLLPLSMMALLSLVTASVQAADPAPLRRGNGPDVETLDPHRVRSVSAGNIARDLFEGLVGEAPDGHVIPGAADRWTVSDDGRHYRFHLRDPLRWSNGDALTAEDFVYGLRRSVDPATASPSAQLLSPIARADAVMAGTQPLSSLGVTAIDAQTLDVELQAATPYFLALLSNPAAFPVHRASLQRDGEHFTDAGRLVSNGAYVLDARVLQSHIALRRNPEYWNAAATRIAAVRYVVTEDMGAELQRFRAGELDISEQVPASSIASMTPALRQQLHVADYLGLYYYGFNVRQAPFDNADLRRALSLAVDREIIVGKLLGSGERAAYRWLPPRIAGADGWQPAWAAQSREQRLVEARRLYARAGYSAAHPLRTQILYNTSDQHQKIAVLISAMWKQFLGVQTELMAQETQVFLQSRRDRRAPIFRGSWISDVDDASSFMDLLLSHNPRNDSGYASPTYDALLAQAAQQTGDARAATLAAAQKQISEDAPVIPIYAYVTKHLVSPRVQGWQDNALDHHLSRDLSLRADPR